MFKSSEYTFNTYERTFKAFERRFLFIIKTSILSKKYSFYMKKIITTLMLCLITLSMTAKGHTAANNRLVIAKAPAGIELKKDFEVKARTTGGEWKDIDTYAFKVDRVADAKHNAEITSVAKFEFEGKVEIQVKSIAQDIKSFKVRPNSYGIEAKQEGNTLTFTRPPPLPLRRNQRQHLPESPNLRRQRIRKTKGKKEERPHIFRSGHPRLQGRLHPHCIRQDCFHR